MATSGDNQSWFRTALVSAVVLGVFTAAAVVLMAWNYRQTLRADPLDSPDLAAMKKALEKAPNDNALKERIRDLDLALRREYFRRQTFAQRGAYILLASFVGFVIAARAAMFLRRRPPIPKEVRETAGEQDRAARAARWAVGGLGLVLAVLAIVWMLMAAGCSIGPAGPDTVAAAKPPPSAEEIRRNWGRFRGPDGLGVATYTSAPVSWNGGTGENILWKAEVPLAGENSPVVWGERVFLTGADEKRREVYCFDAGTGRLAWQAKVETPESRRAKPPEPLEEAGFAAPTAATDGRYVCAVFANGDLACFQVDGTPVWTKSLGVPDNSYGHAASLLIWKDLLLVPFDQGAAKDSKSRLIALDLATGRQAWAAERPVGSSWATPILAAGPRGTQIVTAADPYVIAYEPATGRELWRAEVLEGDIAPSPVFAGGLVYVTSVNCNLSAIRTDGSGDVTRTHVAWKAAGEMPNTTGPLAGAGHVWVLTTDGLLTCFDAADGAQVYQHDFVGLSFKGSPTLVGDRVYAVGAKGVTAIFSAGDAYRELARADLGEPANCSPAFLDGRIYIRGKKHLYCIGSASL